MSIHDDIQRAGKALSDAQIQLADALKAAYPVGAVLRVGLGNAKVNVRVTRHARAPGNRPGELSGLNVNTGKLRTFHYSKISEVVDAAPGGGEVSL